MRFAHAPRRAREATTRRERGAAVLELAIIVVFILTMIAGAFDYGQGWRASLAVNEGVRGGARVGSGMGSNVEADIQILTTLKATLASNGTLDRVERVVIFSAQSTGGKPSAACIAGTGGTCNTFTGAQFRNVVDGSAKNAQGCITGSTRAGWCPTNRNSVQQTAEYVGVWVQARHDNVFPFLGKFVTIQRSAVMRIEP